MAGRKRSVAEKRCFLALMISSRCVRSIYRHFLNTNCFIVITIAFFAYEPDHDEPMWVRLWAEGMATYVSQRMSPSATYMDTMWMTDKKVADLYANSAVLAASFLRSFYSITETNADHYFLQDVSSDPKIPGHTGYYLGVRVAKLLSQRYSMVEMAHWSRTQAEPHVRDALRQMAARTNR